LRSRQRRLVDALELCRNLVAEQEQRHVQRSDDTKTSATGHYEDRSHLTSNRRIIGKAITATTKQPHAIEDQSGNSHESPAKTIAKTVRTMPTCVCIRK
jgi:hypothetical protein